MSKRPEHATDCPGCDTGWTASGLLCKQCENAVNTSNPILYPQWLEARHFLDAVGTDAPSRPSGPEGWAAIEAFRRGLIVGTARVLSSARAAQHAIWGKKKP